MFTYKITFIALTDTVTFEIASKNKELVDGFAEDFLLLFAKIDGDKIIVESFQKNTNEIRNKINKYVDGFKKELTEANGITAYFRKLLNDEHFFFLPNFEYDQIQSLRIINYLKAVSGESNAVESKEINEMFGKLFKKYVVRVFGPNRIAIGERERSLRICRFCDNNSDKVTFAKRAHAISEGLGNKTVTLLEECDDCNDKFSKTIEPDAIQYLSLFRTIFDVKGKGGSKKFRGENFELSNSDEVVLRFQTPNDEPKEFSLPFNLKLDTNVPISFQNIYRSLCKFFISVIDREHVKFFSQTIKWINGDLEIKRLPKVGHLISYHGFTKQPKLVTYLRKDKDFRYPFAVGEFYFTCQIIVFIVPLANEDSKEFLTHDEFDEFWSLFQHYKITSGWKFMDLSDDVKKKFTINLQIELNNDKKNTNAQQA